MVLVVGQSLKDTFSDSLRSAVRADYIISAPGNSGVPKTLAAELRDAGAGTVISLDEDLVQIRSPVAPDWIEQTDITVTDLANIGEVANLDIRDGSLSSIDPASAILVHDEAAADWGLSIGDEVELTPVSGETVKATVGAVFTETQQPFWGEWLIDASLQEQMASTHRFDDWVAVKAAGDDPTAAQAAIGEVLADYPQVGLEDRREFQETAESNLNTALALVNVFLLFALVVALVGIANTLTLSVFERTHEIGLLRAVGMTRRQLRRVIRWEAATIALYGAIIGVALGLAFGVALSVAIPDEIIDRVAVPGGQIVALVLVAVAFGLLAAVFPSYRAGRMNVLEAIAAD